MASDGLGLYSRPRLEFAPVCSPPRPIKAAFFEQKILTPLSSPKLPLANPGCLPECIGISPQFGAAELKQGSLTVGKFTPWG